MLSVDNCSQAKDPSEVHEFAVFQGTREQLAILVPRVGTLPHGQGLVRGRNDRARNVTEVGQ